MSPRYLNHSDKSHHYKKPIVRDFFSFLLFLLVSYREIVSCNYTLIRFRRDHLYHYFSLRKSSENIFFIFLIAFYLIIWKPQRILKICELVYFWGVKTHFGKLKSTHSGEAFDASFLYWVDFIPQNDHQHLNKFREKYLCSWQKINRKWL